MNSSMYYLSISPNILEINDRALTGLIKMIFLFLDWQEFSVFQYIFGHSPSRKDSFVMSVRKFKCIFILDFSISSGVSPYIVALECISSLLISSKIKPSLAREQVLMRFMLRLSLKLSRRLFKFSMNVTQV